MRSVGRNIVGLAAVAIALAGCGSGGHSNATSGSTEQPSAGSQTTIPAPAPTTATHGEQAVLLRAVTLTAEAKTAHLSMHVSFTGLGAAAGGRNLDVQADGAVDFGSTNATLTLSLGVLGQFEERIVDGIIYIRLPAFANAPKPWVRIDPKKLLGASLQSLSQGQTDPSQFLSYLGGVSDDVTKLGPDTVRGTATTRYHATLDMAKALARPSIPPQFRERLRVLAPQLGSAHVPIDVWIDAQGRARKLVLQLAFSDVLRGSAAAGSVPPGASMTIELELFDFGIPVHVEAPPADQVTSR